MSSVTPALLSDPSWNHKGSPSLRGASYLKGGTVGFLERPTKSFHSILQIFPRHLILRTLRKIKVDFLENSVTAKEYWPSQACLVTVAQWLNFGPVGIQIDSKVSRAVS